MALHHKFAIIAINKLSIYEICKSKKTKLVNVMKNNTLIALFVVSIVFTLNANAAKVIDADNQRWLSLDVTRGMSTNEVNQYLNSGGEYFGSSSWRYASASEAISLFDSYGIGLSNDRLILDYNNVRSSSLISDFGINSWFRNSWSSRRSSGSYSSNTFNALIYAASNDVDKMSMVHLSFSNSFSCSRSRFGGSSCSSGKFASSSISSNDFNIDYKYDIRTYYGGGYNSSLLIYDESVPPQVTQTPIPASVWLFVSGILGLVGFRKKIGSLES